MSMNNPSGEDNDGRQGEEDPDLSEHSVAMRKASQYCEDLFDRSFEANHVVNINRLGDDYDATIVPLTSSLLIDQRERRLEAYERFWSQRAPEIPIFRIAADKDGKIPQDQVWDFQDTFQKLNLPCLVLGLDRTHFDRVNNLWRTVPKSQLDDCGIASQQIIEGRINRRWFLDTLGHDWQVPLRYHEDVGSGEHDRGQKRNEIDSEGRAVECRTRIVAMTEWVDRLVEAKLGEPHGGRSEPKGTGQRDSRIYYLKDWHLQQELQGHAESEYVCPPLYECPDIFGHDMLNSFLMRFTRGDYRFCYWGPALSSTPRHSDVLHSFSWSYNVVGTKEWTFFGPSIDNHNICNGDHQGGKSFSVRQESGQAIFVPATWQHTVVNLEETISINHNWVTMANLELTWDCLCTEMVAICVELQRWGTSVDVNDMDACESILRGCVGLDVTSFLLMTLVRLLELETVVPHQVWTSRMTSDGCPENSSCHPAVRSRHDDERSCLVAVLGNVLGQHQTLVQLPRRLQAVLRSDSLAKKVEAMATKVVETFIVSRLQQASKTSEHCDESNFIQTINL
jgi:hypothetical protein